LEIDLLNRSLVPQPLEEKAFEEFGNVIDASIQKALLINDGNTERFNDLAELALNQGGGKPSVNIFRSKPVCLPFLIKSFERHPLSSQLFFPLSEQPYLVVVAPKGDFVSSKIKAFMASPNQGVNYHPGTWHHYNLALNEVSDFLVIDRVIGKENCDEVEIEEGEQVIISAI
jgi:ureidoglycolate lyase